MPADSPTPAATPRPYRGRLAPSPTGHLHPGHARTFWTARERARAAGGSLILRIEDLDRQRCKPGFQAAMMENLAWFGFQWQEGPDRGGSFGPYRQSERRAHYRQALETLRVRGCIYPCSCSRKDIQSAARAPHAADDDEPLYPGICRPREPSAPAPPGRPGNWRFRVPEGEAIAFVDTRLGPVQFVVGRDFGDFLVWRHDDIPSYQLAVVMDDAAMQITEVVRGEDLLKSTARQLLLYRALNLEPPAFHHCPLLKDDSGVRLAKRHDGLSLRALRAAGKTPESLRAQWD